jgi:hypothetical protein
MIGWSNMNERLHDMILYGMSQDAKMTSFFRFVDKRAIYRWYNLIRTCAGECD